jgi:hypothetical protein
MSVKSFKWFLFAFFSVLVFFSVQVSAFAASALVGDDSAVGKKSGGDYEMERNIEGGIHVECLGIKKSSSQSHVLAEYAVTAEDDVIIEIGMEVELFDDEGRKFARDNIWIGGDSTIKREIIGGVRTIVQVRFNTRMDNYQVRSIYPKLTFVVNGKSIVFRDVPGK